MWVGLDFGLWLGFMGLIYFMSSRPAVESVMFFPHIDKVYHFGAYGLMAALGCRAFSHLFSQSFWVIWCGAMAASLFGITDEFHQFFVPGRSSSVGDIFADVSGAWCGALLWQLWLLPFLRRWFPAFA